MDFDDIIQSVEYKIGSIRSYAKLMNYKGYDPYDILEKPVVRSVLFRGNGLSRFFAPFFSRLIYQLPRFSRWLFDVKPSVNAKGMGLFAYAYLRMFELQRREEYRTDAEQCLSWLKKNYSRGYSGYAWGYPFNWQSRIFIPRETPSAVVTVTVANAFLKHFELTSDRDSLEIARSSVSFLLNDLNTDTKEPDKLCFSYTPLDRFHIHNANLMVSAYLFDINRFLCEKLIEDYAFRALNYTLADQRQDGAFEYWGEEDRVNSHIDLYHTGFVLRSLKRIYELKGLKEVKEALRKGAEFFLKNFFTESWVPKTVPYRLYPVDIHSVAESILTLSTVDEFPFETRLLALREIFEFSRRNMWSKKGYYFYHLRRHRRIKIPYMRWAQAWMFRALVEYLSLLTSIKDEKQI